MTRDLGGAVRLLTLTLLLAACADSNLTNTNLGGGDSGDDATRGRPDIDIDALTAPDEGDVDDASGGADAPVEAGGDDVGDTGGGDDAPGDDTAPDAPGDARLSDGAAGDDASEEVGLADIGDKTYDADSGPDDPRTDSTPDGASDASRDPDVARVPDADATADATADPSTDPGPPPCPAPDGRASGAGCPGLGLRAWYRLDGEAGGVSDSSGCASDGANSGAERGVCGVFGQAFAFDAAMDHVAIADAEAMEGFSALTIEAWVYPESTGFASFIALGDGINGDSWFFGTFNDGRLSATLGGTPACIGMSTFNSSAAPLALGRWTHAAVTVDLVAGTVSFFQDGVFTDSVEFPYDGFCAPGAGEGATMESLNTTSPTWGFIGVLDELRVWNTVRTEAEICADAGGVYGAGCELGAVLP
jgi:hypothetical protein